MRHDAINHTVKLTVEDGKYYLDNGFPWPGLSKTALVIWPSSPIMTMARAYGQYGTVEAP